MATVTICSDLGAQKIKSVTVSIVSPSIYQMPWSLFSECWALSQLFLSPLSLSFFFLPYIFYWSIVDLPSFKCTARWFSYTYVKVKVSQSCLTLCDPMDCTVPGILQARILEWVPFPFCRRSSQPRDWTQVSGIAGRFFTSWAIREIHEWVKSLSRVRLFVTPWTVAYQAPPSMGFSRQEYWSGLPFPSPSSFTFIKRLLSSSSLSAIRVVSSAYLRLLIFLPEILIPVCVSSSPVFLMMYSA